MFLTYTPKPLTSDSQRIGSTTGICSTFSTEMHMANALFPSPDLIQSPTELLLLTRMNPCLETTTLDHCSPSSPKQSSAVPYPQSPNSSAIGLWAGFHVSGKRLFSKGQHFCSVQALQWEIFTSQLKKKLTGLQNCPDPCIYLREWSQKPSLSSWEGFPQ